jgi:hypothetical protein
MYIVLVDIFWFGHADVGPDGREEDAPRGLADEQVEEGRPRKCRQFGGVGPGHATEAGLTHAVGEVPIEGHGRVEPRTKDQDMEELRRRLEGVLDGVPKDLWLWIWDKGILDLCIGG